MGDSLAARLLGTTAGLAGLLLLLAAAIMAVAAPWLFPADPFDIVARPLLRPFSQIQHPLGTDRLGRDLLAMIAHGTRPSLVTALSVAAVALGIGLATGALAGVTASRGGGSIFFWTYESEHVSWSRRLLSPCGSMA
jgi:peptide/nickel transport system permease protein